MELLEALIEGPGGCEAERSEAGARFLPDLCRGAADSPRALRCLVLLSGARATAVPLPPSALAALGEPLNANLPGVSADGARTLLRGLGRDQLSSPAGARAALAALLPSLGAGDSGWEAEAQGLLLEAAGAQGQRLAAFLSLAAGLAEPSAVPAAAGTGPAGRLQRAAELPDGGLEAVAALGFILGQACSRGAASASASAPAAAATEVAARLGAAVLAERGPEVLVRAVVAALRGAGGAAPGAGPPAAPSESLRRACQLLGRVLEGLPPDAARGGAPARELHEARRAIAALTGGMDAATAAAGTDLLDGLDRALGSPRSGLRGWGRGSPGGGGDSAAAGGGGGTSGAPSPSVGSGPSRFSVPFGKGSEQLVAAAGAEVFVPEAAFSSARDGAEAVGDLQRALESIIDGKPGGSAWEDLKAAVGRCEAAAAAEAAAAEGGLPLPAGQVAAPAAG